MGLIGIYQEEPPCDAASISKKTKKIKSSKGRSILTARNINVPSASSRIKGKSKNHTSSSSTTLQSPKKEIGKQQTIVSRRNKATSTTLNKENELCPIGTTSSICTDSGISAARGRNDKTVRIKKHQKQLANSKSEYSASVVVDTDSSISTLRGSNTRTPPSLTSKAYSREMESKRRRVSISSSMPPISLRAEDSSPLAASFFKTQQHQQSSFFAKKMTAATPTNTLHRPSPSRFHRRYRTTGNASILGSPLLMSPLKLEETEDNIKKANETKASKNQNSGGDGDGGDDETITNKMIRNEKKYIFEKRDDNDEVQKDFGDNHSDHEYSMFTPKSTGSSLKHQQQVANMEPKFNETREQSDYKTNNASTDAYPKQKKAVSRLEPKHQQKVPSETKKHDTRTYRKQLTVKATPQCSKRILNPPLSITIPSSPTLSRKGQVLVRNTVSRESISTIIAKSPPLTSPNSVRGERIGHTWRRATPRATSAARITFIGTESTSDMIEQQYEALTAWWNHQISQQSSLESTIRAETKSQESSNGMWGTLLLHRRLSRTRMKAKRVFQSQDMQRAQRAMRSEIQKGRLALRSDQDVTVDLTLQKKLVRLLLSYSTVWLQVGLEAVLKDKTVELPSVQTICTEARSQSRYSNQNNVLHKVRNRVKSVLKDIIINRLLSDKELLQKYTNGRSKVPSGKFGEKYRAELRAVVLNRLLTLVVFLDKARMDKVIDEKDEPCLFSKNSRVKSTRDVCLFICRDFLASEANFVKHLSRLGIELQYQQDPLDEIDFTITSFLSDLRSGVRLARITELYFHLMSKSLLCQMRLPAVSRLQKLHNVGVVLESLKKNDETNSEYQHVECYHVVDGYPEPILKLLWSIVLHTSIPNLVDTDLIEQEIKNIDYLKKLRRDSQLVNLRKQGPDAPIGPNVTSFVDYESTLLRWCNAVCSTFGVRVWNLDKSFSDGIVLCLLIHFYHRKLLKLGEIHRFDPHRDDQRNRSEKNRANITLAVSCMQELGGIPNLIGSTVDFQHPPNSRCTLLLLSYLFSRLTASSQETLACTSIQRWIRRTKRAERMQRIENAVSVIAAYWKKQKTQYYEARRRKYQSSVTVVERFVIRVMGTIRKLRDERLVKFSAATTIQSCVRMFLVYSITGPHLQQNRAATVIQGSWRSFWARYQLEYARLERDAATLVQTSWRRYIDRRRFIDTVVCAIYIQASYRRCKVLRELATKKVAVLTIQTAIRGCQGRLFFRIAKTKVVVIQSVVRRALSRIERSQSLRAIRTLQTQTRRFLSEGMRAKETAAVKIQCFIRKSQSMKLRRCLEMQLLNRQLNAVLTLQHFSRGKLARQNYQRLCAMLNIEKEHQAAIIVQSVVRTFLARVRVQIMYLRFLGSIIVQTWWRKTTKVQRFQLLKSRFCRVQALFRGQSTRKKLQVQHDSAIKIQTLARSFFSQIQFRINILDIITSQSVARCWLVRREWKQKKFSALKLSRFLQKYSLMKVRRRDKSALVIQQLVRWHLASKEVELRRSSVTTLIDFGRAIIAKNSLKRRLIQFRAIVTIQTAARRCLVHAHYNALVGATVQIQSLVRCFLAKAAFQNDLSNCIKLQAWLRRCLVRHLMCHINRNAIKIQNWWHSVLMDRLICRRNEAAVTIQSVVRCQMVCSRAQRKVWCSIIIQCLVRQRQASKAMSSLRSCYNDRCGRGEVAVTIIQSYFRQSRCQRAILADRANEICKEEIEACVSIQRIIRGSLSWTRHHQSRHSVVRIQSWWRTVVLSRQFELVKCGIQQLQALVRGKTLRQHEKTRCLSAIVIQKEWRCVAAMLTFHFHIIKIQTCQSVARRWKAQREVNSIRCAIVILQSWVRCRLAVAKIETMRATAKERCRTFKAASIIQKSWRCHIVQIDYMICLLGIIAIQRRVRSFLRQKHLRIAKDRLIEFQARCRGALDRARIRAFLRGIVKLQSVMRGALVRKMALTAAATIIQCRTRGFLRRMNQEATHVAAITIQCAWKKFIARVEFLYQRVMVVKLQCRVRIMVAQRKYYGQQLTQYVENKFMNKMVSKIQKCNRRYKSVIRRHEAALVLQGFFQRWVTSFIRTKRVHLLRMGIIKLQSVVRGTKARKLIVAAEKSATCIQRHTRGYLNRVQLEKYSLAASKIQRIWRGFVAFIDFKYQHVMIVRIQVATRSFLSCRKADGIRRVALLEQVELKYINANALKIQKYYHRHKINTYRYESACVVQRFARRWILYLVARKRIRIIKKGLSKFQSIVRGAISRRLIELSHQAATTIQRYVRRSSCRILFKDSLKAANEIQRYWRGFVARIESMYRYVMIVRMQSSVRMYLSVLKAQRCLKMKLGEKAEIEFVNKTAAKIQNCYRRHKDTCMMNRAATIVQKCIRRCATQRLARKKMYVCRHGMIKLQAVVRGGQIRRKQNLLHGAAIQIQCQIRRSLIQIELEVHNFAACEIQRQWRGSIARFEVMNQLFLIVKLQAACRMFLARNKTLLKRHAKQVEFAESRFFNKVVSKIQNCYRQHRWFLLATENAVIIQKHFRRRSRAGRILRGAISLQRIIRGHLIRKRRGRVLGMVAFRLEKATLTARYCPLLTLADHTDRALRDLKGSSYPIEVVESLQVLKKVTSLSKECCMTFVQFGAPRVLYLLISMCNRSSPHIIFVECAIATLCNVANHDELLPYVAVSNSANVLIDLLQLFRDRDSIVKPSVSLLEYIVNTDCRERRVCCKSENVWRLQHILSSRVSHGTMKHRRHVSPNVCTQMLRDFLSSLF